MKIVEGERLDYDERNVNKVNCAGCYYHVGKLCTYHHAFTQTNPHRPTDCSHWTAKKEESEDE